jgi:hypothetical protein
MIRLASRLKPASAISGGIGRLERHARAQQLEAFAPTDDPTSVAIEPTGLSPFESTT